MKIKVKVFNENCKFKFIDKGEFIDLHSAERVELTPPFANILTKNRTVRTVEFDTHLIHLGIGMKLPKGFEAIVLPRSGTFKNYGIIQTNHVGVIDSSYSGPDDEWKMQVVVLQKGAHEVIEEGDRICQFRIRPSQKATVWQKIKWLFTSKIEFEFVNDYEGVSRGGYSSTGVK